MSRLEEMNCFVRVVEAGTITAAAEQMTMAKSAVSKSLTQLEKRLGITLIKRTTRSMKLTEAGRDYYRQCVRLLTDLDDVESTLRRDQTDLRGHIRLSVPISYGLLKLSPLFIRFTDYYPDIQLDIDFSDRHVDLISDGFDLAIRIASLKDSTLVAKRLSTTRMRLCGSPDYFELNGKPDTVESLLHHHHKLHYVHVSPTWSLPSSSGEILSINIPTAMHANNGEFLLQAAIAGKGLVLSPDFICDHAIETGQLEAILEEAFSEQSLGVYAVYPQDRFLSKRVRVLIDFLQSELSAQS
jgi:DNA-binding transcriptional LysR family regulator